MTTENNDLDSLKQKADEARAKLAAMLESRNSGETGSKGQTDPDPSLRPTLGQNPLETPPKAPQTGLPTGIVQEKVGDTLKQTEKPRLAHPLGGLDQPTILPVEKIYTPPKPEPTPLPPVAPPLDKVVAEVNSAYNTPTPTPTKKVERTKITYAWYMKAAVLAALIFFGMSLFMNGSQLNSVYSNPQKATAVSQGEGKAAVCNYVFTKDKVDYSFVAPDGCTYKDGEEVTIWVNDAYTDFTEVNPSKEKMKHYGTIGFAFTLLMASLYWVYAARRKVKRTII